MVRSLPMRSVGATVGLIVVGTVLAFGTSLLLASFAPGAPRYFRVVISYLVLPIPLLVAVGPRAAAFGFRRERLDVAVTSGAIVAAVLVVITKGTILVSGPSPDQLLALVMFAIVALVEEGMFRGVLQRQLIAWLGRWRGLPAGAALFTVFHVPQRLIGGSGGADLAVSLIPVFLLGCVLGLFMLPLRNIALPVIVHAAVDWVGSL